MVNVITANKQIYFARSRACQGRQCVAKIMGKLDFAMEKYG
jgi:hypothetical protein